MSGKLPGRDWLFAVSTLAALAVLIATAGGGVCGLFMLAIACGAAGLLPSVWLRDRTAKLWAAAVVVAVVPATVIGGVLAITRPARIFRDVFRQEPPADVRLTRAEVTTVVLDPAGQVVLDGVDAEQVARLCEAAGLRRDAEAERQVRESPQFLPQRAPGTDFLDDVDPETTLHVFTGPHADDRRLREVIYLPKLRRAHAFWIDF